ncbi:thymidylate kinase [Desulfonispora thiosulfatigenes DSM 11270]|uniref:Thymidylate kinase n=1 Tax=Desulfonispora thiosulfatigenes DSM 11270 TaxID=656914 RepID=A0A1W1V0X9_DESTI|nr:dTMP kinase [Desulfonispora thiosulfatigenes]SMB86952.1 thymidylate kinase [Desulfonispora thiosulfatigenes DSM 11270]
MSGKFITIEGCDGSGKTTQINLLENKLKELRVSCMFTREPGGTLISEKIRNIILDNKNSEMVWKAEALLYAASRAQLVGEKIIPLLEQNVNVICDRYIDSTLAYQGYGRGLDKIELDKLNYFATSGLKPHLTILLDIEPSEAARRRKTRKEDRLEQEKLGFHQRVREGYLHLVKLEPTRFKVISALQTKEEIHQQILENILNLINDKK